MKKHERDYIIWQNRAFRFYIASRLLANKELYGPGAFCGNQAIELLMKATLIFWDKSFIPEDASHKFKKMLYSIGNKAPIGKKLSVPEYLFADQRYQSVARYPSSSRKGIVIPSTFVEDLDSVFTDLVALVPFQFNSELLHALSGKEYKKLLTLRRGNKQMRRLRKLLRVSISNAA